MSLTVSPTASYPTHTIPADREATTAQRFPVSAISSAVLVVATGMGLVACGGGGSSAPASAPVMLSGQAIKGPVTGGQVCAYTLATPRQQIACATTDANAKYSLALPPGTGEVLLEVTGGSYIDEATGNKVALSTALRTLSKAGDASNALITPFTELAVQLASASVSNPGGNLSLVGFQTQIGQLEAGLGITGLASGNPFGGKSTSDQNYLEALTAFSKLQAGQGKDVGGALQIMGSQLDKCGVSGLGVSLAVYGALGPTTTSSAGGTVINKLAQTSSATLNIVADNVTINDTLPSPCVSGVVIDGVPEMLIALDKTNPPASWLTAKSVEITQCTGALQGNWNFPAAKVLVHAPSASFNSGVSITSLGSYQLDSAVKAIDLNSSGISLNTATGCLQITGVGKANDPFGLSIVGSAGGLGTISPVGGSVSVGGGSGAVVITGSTAGSGAGSVNILGSLTSNGQTFNTNSTGVSTGPSGGALIGNIGTISQGGNVALINGNTGSNGSLIGVNSGVTSSSGGGGLIVVSGKSGS